MDGILQAQAKADAGYFAAKCGRAVDEAEARAIEAAFLKAYRWQYIHSGAQHPHFGKVLSSLITETQGKRIQSALASQTSSPPLFAKYQMRLCSRKRPMTERTRMFSEKPSIPGRSAHAPRTTMRGASRRNEEWSPREELNLRPSA